MKLLVIAGLICCAAALPQKSVKAAPPAATYDAAPAAASPGAAPGAAPGADSAFLTLQKLYAAKQAAEREQERIEDAREHREDLAKFHARNQWLTSLNNTPGGGAAGYAAALAYADVDLF